MRGVAAGPAPGGQAFSVEAFGAVPDSTSNQAPAIQAAIDAAYSAFRETGRKQAVYIPHGTFSLAINFSPGGGHSRALTGRSGLRLCGPGTLRVMDNQSDGTTGNYFQVIGHPDMGQTPMDGFEIDGLTVDMNAQGNPTTFRTLTDVSTSQGSNTVTSPSGNFSAADVGRAFVLPGAFPGGRAPNILAVNSATEVVLSENATATTTDRTAAVAVQVGRRFLACYNGRDVQIRNCTFINIGDVYSLVQFHGATNTPSWGPAHCVNITIANNRFYNVATDTGVGGYHDCSLVFFAGNGLTCNDNIIEADGRSRFGAVQAMELHGTNILATGNRITNFRGGISYVAVIEPWERRYVTIAHNTVQNCVVGYTIAIGRNNYWTGSYDGEDVLFAHNVATVDRDQWTATPTHAGIADVYFSGIYGNFYAGKCRNVKIHDNTFRFLQYENHNYTNLVHRMSGVRWISAATYVVEDLSICDNYCEGSPGHGITIDGVFRRLTVSRNRIVNPGAGNQSGSDLYGGISIAHRTGTTEDCSVNDNQIVDDRETRRMGGGIFVTYSNPGCVLVDCEQLDNRARAADGSYMALHWVNGIANGSGYWFTRFRTPVAYTPNQFFVARFGSEVIDEQSGCIWRQTTPPFGNTWRQVTIP